VRLRVWWIIYIYIYIYIYNAPSKHTNIYYQKIINIQIHLDVPRRYTLMHLDTPRDASYKHTNIY
jgi:hypothetical protein